MMILPSLVDGERLTVHAVVAIAKKKRNLDSRVEESL